MVVRAEAGFRLGRNPDTVLGPDAAVVGRDQLRPRQAQLGFLELAPAIVVEIVPPSDGSTTVSGEVDAYLAGVQVVWVFEPGARAVRVYTRAGPEARLRAESGDVLRTESVLPGFEILLTELFTAIT